jgi:hypothetical protein
MMITNMPVQPVEIPRASVAAFTDTAMEAGPVTVRSPSVLPQVLAAPAAEPSNGSSDAPSTERSSGVPAERTSGERAAFVQVIDESSLSSERDSGPPERDSFPPGDPESISDPFTSRRSWVPPRRSITHASKLTVTPFATTTQSAVLLPVERGIMPLFAASIFSFVLVLALLVWPAPWARTIQGGFWWGLEVLTNDGFWKQVTGYALVALSTLTLTLSLRKRWKRFAFSDIPIWRMIHSVIGVLAIAMLIAHTGFRIGRQMLGVLMVIFVLVVSLGALAGLITVLSTGWENPIKIRDQRLRWSRVHLALCWLLPLLILLHIFQVYYF